MQWHGPSPLVAAVGIVSLLVVPAAARQQAPESPVHPAIAQGTAVELTNGWALLADGSVARAQVVAARLLSNYPGNPAVLGFAIEVDITAGGAIAALTTYEQWLGQRTEEEPLVLRRIATALLAWFAQPTVEAPIRIEALKALVADGNAAAGATMVAAAKAGSEADLRALAALGNESALDQFAARMRLTKGPKWRDLAVLSESRSVKVIAPLVEVLSDPDPQNRVAAIEALGRLGRPEAIPHLQPLLQDSRPAVRVSAAGALFQLGDVSGAAVLHELAANEEPSVRMSAAIFLASRPDEAWLALVRGLAATNDPMIRLEAARLMARHDPEWSRQMFEQLLADPNPVVQEEVGAAVTRVPVFSLRAIRPLLRHTSPSIRVQAAGRVLQLTR